MVDLKRALRNEPYLERMFEVLRASPQPIMVEAGACDGYHTEVFRTAVPGLRHYGFEADPRNLQKLAERFPVAGVTTIIPAALGSVSGLVPFHLATPEPNGAIGASSLSEFQPSLTHAHPWLHCQSSIVVPCHRLDDFMVGENIDHVDLLWLDVQGAECLVFDGMRACWECVRWIYTEFDAGYADSRTLPALLEQLNSMPRTEWYATPPWEIALEVPGNVLLRNRIHR